MRKVLLALDMQPAMKTPEMIVKNTNDLVSKIPTMATVLVKQENPPIRMKNINIEIPESDSSLVNTKYTYKRHGYGLPEVIIQTLLKNKVEEVLVAGAATEAALLGAGFSLFDAGIRASLIAPLCLTGQYHQHSVTMKIWENSIGQVYESLPEAGFSL